MKQIARFRAWALLLGCAGPAAAGDETAADGPWVNPPAEKVPGIEHHTFASKAMGRKVGYNIYLPPDYAKDRERRFPVVYHLHGRTDSESSHLGNLRLIDRAVRDGKVPPIICVYAYAGRHSWFTDWKDGTVKSEAVVRELIGHVDATYRTVNKREGRGLLGWSMGGYGALRLVFESPDLACAAVTFGGGFLTADEMKKRVGPDFARVFGDSAEDYAARSPLSRLKERAPAVRGRVALRLVVGTKDFLLDNNRRLHRQLEAAALPHEYEELPGLGHDPRAVYDAALVGAFQFFARAFGENAGGR